MKLFTAILTTALSLTACVAAKGGAAPTATDSLNSVSVYAVLATALPMSLLDLAVTNPAQATKVIASEFASGATPAWFSNLPKDIQTYLVPVTTIKQAPGALGSAFPSLATVLQTVSVPSSLLHHNHTMSRNHTMHYNHTMSRTKSLAMSMPITSTVVTTSSTPSATSTSSSKGGAAAPTAVIGAGLAGALGLIGMLAL